MNRIKQFIDFYNFGVNPLRFNGHEGRTWIQKGDVHLADTIRHDALKNKW